MTQRNTSKFASLLEYETPSSTFVFGCLHKPGLSVWKEIKYRVWNEMTKNGHGQRNI